MSNSAHKHTKAGQREKRPKREPSINANLIDFLEAKGIYQRGRRSIDFRSQKRIDWDRAA